MILITPFLLQHTQTLQTISFPPEINAACKREEPPPALCGHQQKDNKATLTVWQVPSLCIKYKGRAQTGIFQGNGA